MYGLGGAEIQCHYFAREYFKQGWEVYFLTKKGKKIDTSFDNEGVKIIHYSKSYNPFKSISTFIKVFINYKFNVVFFRNNTHQLGTLAALSKLLKFNLIWSVKHDDFCGKDAATKKNRLENQNITLFLKIKWLIQDKLFQYGVRNSLLLIAQNRYQQKKIKNDFGLESTILYSGINIPEYNFQRKNNILFIATIRKFKRPELFCQLAENLSNNNYQFLLIGENYSTKSDSDILLHRIANSKVNYQGSMPLEQVQKLLNKSKLLINTSTAEGFPNTFVQAFAHGVPVISLDVNTDNLITDHDIGYFANGDMEKMTYLIKQIMENDALWAEKSKNAYDFARYFLNINKNVSSLNKILFQGNKSY